jgi:arylsulfatase A-like enzyme
MHRGQADRARPEQGVARTKLILWAGLAVAVAAGLVYVLSGGSGKRPCVILISIDSLRPDHLGCYGYTKNTSPTLDRFAGEGVLFETAWSSTSWTLPAHAALFTSLPDRVHGCYDAKRWLGKNRFTLAEAFREAGYKTVGFFSGPFLHPYFGLAQGFDSYHDCTSYSKMTIDLLKGKSQESPLTLAYQDVTNETVLNEVTRWLDRNREYPFFAFIHLWDVHFDYIPPAPYVTMFDPDYSGSVTGALDDRFRSRPESVSDRDVAHLQARYDGEIRWTDDTLAKLFAVLKSHGLFDTTAIVVTADHGEAFREHGRFGHQHSLYEEEIRIPLLVRYPPSVPAGRRIREPVHLIDVAPTLLALAGAPPMPHALGRDLTPRLQDLDDPASETPILSELIDPLIGHPLFALRGASWKLVRDVDTGELQVFDLGKDPRELRPLAEKEYPRPPQELNGMCKTTARRLDKAARRLPIPTKRDTPPIPTMTEAQLRDLGYLK